MPPVAAIDIGSNAMRMLVADIDESGRVQPILTERESIRLGAEVFSVGRIREDTILRMERAFRGFREILRREAITAVRAVGTSALREAVNGLECVDRVSEASKIPIEIISGEEEGQLVFRAIRATGVLKNEPALLIEIGGGSIEVSVAAEGRLVQTECLPLGTVRLLELTRNGGFTSRMFQRFVREYVRDISRSMKDRYQTFSCCIGTGGNCDELGDLRKKLFPGTVSAELSVGDLQRLFEVLEGMSYQERQEKLGLRPDRADVIVPAAVVLLEILRSSGMSHLELPHVGLKEGLIHELRDARTADDDVRTSGRRSRVLSSARELGRRFLFDEPHGEAVSEFAVTLFRQLKNTHGLPDRFELLLEVAALLHDVGQSIHHREHHKHSYYILRHTSISSLNDREQRIVAAVARYHRKATPKTKHDAYTDLEPEDRHPVEVLSGILRIADALDRQHRGVIQSVTVLTQPPDLVLGVVAGDTYQPEADALVSKGELFRSLFGGTILLEKHA